MLAWCRSSVTGPLRVRGTRRSIRIGCLAAALAALLLAGLPAPAPAQSIVAIVNGLPITSYDIEQRSRLLRLSGARRNPTRQDVLEEIINEKVKLREAKRWGIEIPQSEVDQAFANMAKGMGYNAQQLAQALSTQGVDPDSLKARIRADLSWSHLVRGRYQASLKVGEGDILAMLEKQQNEKQSVGYEYVLRPILFIVPQGSPPSLTDARRREAEALRNRFEGCEAGIAFARALRDVAVRAPIIRTSAEIPAPLRTMLNNLTIGRLTAPELTPQGVQLFALCGKRETQADTPEKKAAREQIFAKKFEEQSKRYLDQVRRKAMIEYK